MMLDLDSEHGPEVFETSSIESIEDLPTNEVNSDLKTEDLIQITAEGFDAAATRNRLQKYAILDENTDFSGSIDAKTVGNSGITVVQWAETKAQKLARLKKEIEGLEAENDAEQAELDTYLSSLQSMIQSAGTEGYYYQRIKQSFSEIDEVVENQIENQIGEISDANEPAQEPAQELKRLSTTTKPTSESLNRKSDFSTICALEARLARIEAAIGTPNTDPTVEHNFRTHLNEISRRVAVLSSPETSLEPVSQAVAHLNKELELLVANRRKVELHLGDRPQATTQANSTPFEARIDRIFSKLPDIESSSRILPALMTRLRTLHEVNTSLATSVGVTESIDKTLGLLLRELEDWLKNLESINGALDASEARFTANAKVVDEKIRAMENRMRKP